MSEALELSSFMEKISRGLREETGEGGGLGELGELGVQDWARLWVQVIHELRNGLKLKKTDYSRWGRSRKLTES